VYQYAFIKTQLGAKTTALVDPDQLYVFSPLHHRVFILMEAS